MGPIPVRYKFGGESGILTEKLGFFLRFLFHKTAKSQDANSFFWSKITITNKKGTGEIISL